MQFPDRNKRRPYFYALLAAGFVVIGLYDLYFSNVSKSWPSTMGIIAASNVSVPSKHDLWGVYVRYEFVVNGVQHSSHTYRFGGSPHFSQHAAEIVVAQYVPGDPVKVFYDPNNPDRAVLAPGIDSDNWQDFICCICGLIGFAYCIKKLSVISNRSDTSVENAKNTQIPV